MSKYRTVPVSVIQDVLDSETVTEAGIFFPLHKGEKLAAPTTIDGQDAWTACDNEDGYAWTEDFTSMYSAKRWLQGHRVRDFHGNWLNS